MVQIHALIVILDAFCHSASDNEDASASTLLEPFGRDIAFKVLDIDEQQLAALIRSGTLQLSQPHLVDVYKEASGREGVKHVTVSEIGMLIDDAATRRGVVDRLLTAQHDLAQLGQSLCRSLLQNGLLSLFSQSRFFDELLRVAYALPAAQVAGFVRELESAGLRLEACMLVMDHLHVDPFLRDLAMGEAVYQSFLKAHKA
jgi:hypothetical protein